MCDAFTFLPGHLSAAEKAAGQRECRVAVVLLVDSSVKYFLAGGSDGRLLALIILNAQFPLLRCWLSERRCGDRKQ